MFFMMWQKKTKKSQNSYAIKRHIKIILFGICVFECEFKIWKWKCDINYIKLHQTLNRKIQHYYLYIEVSEHSTFISLLTYHERKTVLLQNYVMETNTKFTFLQIGCCIMQWVLSPTRKDNDAEAYEIYYGINMFLHSHLATQEAVLRLIANELHLICMLLITDDACSWIFPQPFTL